jgi:hypothetical protein
LNWNIKAVGAEALTVFQAKSDMVEAGVRDEIAPWTLGDAPDVDGHWLVAVSCCRSRNGSPGWVAFE